MIKLKQSEQHVPEYLSLGGYCRFNRCPALHCFHSILRLKTTEISNPLSYGTAMHCAMPFLQRKQPEKALAGFAKSWALTGADGDDKRNLTRAAASLSEWYARGQNKPQRYKVIEPPTTGYKQKKPRSDQEFAFVCSLGDESYLFDFYGIVDAVVEVQDDLWLLEYKTTSELGNRFTNAFAINAQCIGYSLAVSLVMNRQVQGVFVEAIRTTKANAQSLCIPVFVADWQMEAFLQTYKRTCRLIRECLSTGEWPQLFGACTCYDQYGQPGYMCNYADLCGCQDWRTMLDGFVIDSFTPFEEISKETKSV